MEIRYYRYFKALFPAKAFVALSMKILQNIVSLYRFKGCCYAKEIYVELFRTIYQYGGVLTHG
jgi:hypothetical protein